MDNIARIEDLKSARNVYKLIMADKESVFYKDELIKKLILKTNEEIDRLEKMLYN